MMKRRLITNLVALADAYADAGGTVSEKTIGWKRASGSKFFERCRAGSINFTLNTYDGVVRWFDENWPDDATWPEFVPRTEDEGLAMTWIWRDRSTAFRCFGPRTTDAAAKRET